MIILGLDPGIAITGYGIIKKDLDVFECLNFGYIKTSQKDSGPERLRLLRAELDHVIKSYKPKVAAIERLFFASNTKTAISVAQARGVILETLASSRIETCEYTPLQVKQAVTGYGRAEKFQVQKMVKLLLNLEAYPRPDDAADALAVAICCANTCLN